MRERIRFRFRLNDIMCKQFRTKQENARLDLILTSSASLLPLHLIMSFLHVFHLHVAAATGPVLRDVSFSIPALQNVAVAGVTGSGKSSLLKAIAGYIQPASGQIVFEGKRVLGPDERLLPGHPSIAYLSQHFELRNNYRVWEELECVNKLDEPEAARIYALCEVDHLLERRTDQLSGGEKQRIVTARLLSTRPKLLLLDEPFSNLDPAHKQTMQRVIKDIGEQLGITCMLVTHDPADSLSWAHRILVMQEGAILQDGTPQQVYRHPQNAYAAGLLGRFNTLTAAQAAAFGLTAENNAPFVRPESFIINTTGVAGTIAAIRYYGSHYEADVQVLDGSITVRTPAENITQGRQVFLSLQLV
jgi:ABC-type sugar transport system ATPase subunit